MFHLLLSNWSEKKKQSPNCLQTLPADQGELGSFSFWNPVPIAVIYTLIPKISSTIFCNGLWPLSIWTPNSLTMTCLHKCKLCNSIKWRKQEHWTSVSDSRMKVGWTEKQKTKKKKGMEAERFICHMRLTSHLWLEKGSWYVRWRWNGRGNVQ